MKKIEINSKSIKQELCSPHYVKNLYANQLFYYYCLHNQTQIKNKQWIFYHKNPEILDYIYRLTHYLQEKNISVPAWDYITPSNSNPHLFWQETAGQSEIQNEYLLLLKSQLCWGKESLEKKLAKHREQYEIRDKIEIELIYKQILKAAFLLHGNITLAKNQTRIEILFKNRDSLEIVDAILNYFSLAHSYSKKNKYEYIYFKKTATISQFLGHIGANQSMLQFEELLVERSVAKQVNSSLNCDVSNINKQIEASLKMIDFFNNLIENDDFLDSLTLQEKEIIVLRLQYPYESLKELGERVNPILNKSQVYYILNKVKKRWTK